MTTRQHILIVDDDPEVGEALSEILADEGYSVGRAGDGAQALEALAAMPTDGILLDLNMPGMNGYEFLERRAADPGLAKIPVIIMSASATRPEATVGTSVIGKPIDVEALLGMLGRRSLAVTPTPPM